MSRLKSVRRGIPQQPVTRPQHRLLHKNPILKPRPSLTPAKPVQTKTKETVKDAPKKQEAVKMDVTSVVDPSTADKSCVGNYELNELMTTMVDAELDDIMPKVKEELSSVIASQKEIFAGDEIIKKTIDKLRNVLGLNVTKRLLNVYNSLYVKIKFHGQPSKENLREFFQKYRFRTFARKSVKIFVARLRNIDDFDNLFSAKEVRCGPVKMTISPVYSFTTCPPNLITKYTKTNYEEESGTSDKDIGFDDEESDVTEDNTTPTTVKASPRIPESNTLTKKTEKVVNTAVTTPKITSQNNSKTETNTTSNKNAPVAETKTIQKIPTTDNKTTIPNKIASQKTDDETSKEKLKKSPELVAKATTTEQKSIKPADNAPVSSQKLNTAQQPSNAAKTPQKPTNNTVSTQPSTKPASNPAVTSQKSTKLATNAAETSQKSTNITVKPQQSTKPASTTVTNVVVTTQQSAKPLSNTPVTSQKSTKPAATLQKATATLQKSAATLQKSPKSVSTTKSTTAKNDYDELDDHDILALISQGIVLDECSGSEED